MNRIALITIINANKVSGVGCEEMKSMLNSLHNHHRSLIHRYNGNKCSPDVPFGHYPDINSPLSNPKGSEM